MASAERSASTQRTDSIPCWAKRASGARRWVVMQFQTASLPRRRLTTNWATTCCGVIKDVKDEVGELAGAHPAVTVLVCSHTAAGHGLAAGGDCIAIQDCGDD